jgi:type IV pilus assembly protein PilW
MQRTLSVQGFSLVEMMIALSLGAVLSLAVIQIMTASAITQELNRALASTQDNGRFIMHRLRTETMHTGRYDALSGSLNRSVDTVEEAAFIRRHPLIMPGDFSSRSSLGSQNNTQDTLVVSHQATRDCRGYVLGYDGIEEFPVVNEFFVEDNVLRCRGFDLRVLRGMRTAVGHNSHSSIALLDGVVSFQVMYGLGDRLSGQITRYVNASNMTDPTEVVALRLALLLQSPESINVDNTHTFKLLDADAIRPAGPFVYRQFETNILLRNTRFVVGELGGVQ